MPKWLWILRKFTGHLWLRASLFCLVGAMTALLSYLLKDSIPEDFSRKLGAEAVYPILKIIANSMLAVAIFSLSTMVSAYTAATSHATPRSTKLLFQDSMAQTALSTFIGSFLYSLVGIIALHIGIYDNSGRLILLGVTIIVILINVVVLIRWIEHLSRLGRLGYIISMVEEATCRAVKERLKQPSFGGKPLYGTLDTSELHALTHSDIGYVQHVDMEKISDVAKQIDAQFYLQTMPGAFNDSVNPILYSSVPLEKEHRTRVLQGFTIGDERSFDQDIRYGFVVLSEIASRALSPAVNDPGTAIAVIHSALRLLVPWVANAPDTDIEFPRLHVPMIALPDILDDIFSPIAREGASKAEVAIHLQKAYRTLAALGDTKVTAQCIQRCRAFEEYALEELSMPEDRKRLSA